MRIILLLNKRSNFELTSYNILISSLRNDIVGIGLVSNGSEFRRGWQWLLSLLYLYGASGIAYKVGGIIASVLGDILCHILPHGQLRTVGEIARQHGIPLWKTSDVNRREFLCLLESLRPDVILNFQGQRLRREALGIPSRGCLNVHPGKLPQYRGVYPVFWALLNDEQTAGICVHIMNLDYDSGPIVAQDCVPLQPGDTFRSAYNRLSLRMPGLVLECLDRIESGCDALIPNRKEEGNYFSYPRLSDIIAFRRKRKRMV
jgi:methionyl-tRNA formyltransferase